MLLMPGYQLMSDDRFINEIIAQKEHIHEVYFSFGELPNGRNNQYIHNELSRLAAQEKQIRDLSRLSEGGIALNLLLNGNCYGADSQSRAFFEKIGELCDDLSSRFLLRSVTTTSPLIGKFLKQNFEALEVRASVNMRIGTEEGMDYVKHYYDGFYIQREYNRDFDHIRQLKAWADQNGKKLYLLANSGCLNFCSAQTFHDNLVSHESDIAKMDNAYQFTGVCKEYLKDPANYPTLYDKTNFIRPEELSLYDGLVTAAKLATRVSKNPVHILRSYVNRRYSGNLLDLLEPQHNIYPYVLENASPPRLVKIAADLPMYEGNENP